MFEIGLVNGELSTTFALFQFYLEQSEFSSGRNAELMNFV